MAQQLCKKKKEEEEEEEIQKGRRQGEREGYQTKIDKKYIPEKVLRNRKIPQQKLCREDLKNDEFDQEWSKDEMQGQWNMEKRETIELRK